MSASVQTAQPVHANPSDGPTPRKRRKRAPAAGAADDCFTCSNRSVKCDRRRPYCTQCLNDSRECAGYKTQLTWGVGVASRGKLRGLSLPVAGTKRIDGATYIQKKKRQPSSISQLAPDIKPAHAKTPSLPSPRSTTSITDSARRVDNGAGSISSAYSASGWDRASNQFTGTPNFETSVKTEPRNAFTLPDPRPPLPSPPYRAFPPRFELPQFNNHDKSASMHSQQQDNGHQSFLQPMHPQVNFVQAPPSTYSPYSPYTPAYNNPFQDMGYISFPRPDESYVRHDAYEPPRPDYQTHDMHGLFQPRTEELVKNLEDEQDIEEIQWHDPNNECAIADDSSAYPAPLSLDFSLALTPFSSAHGIGKTPRMQFLINYYTEVISPVIVAFDGPNNPYRTQILRLAQSSETLQHAISALAASNLRQRRETGVLSTGKTDPARRSSMAHLSLTDEAWHEGSTLSPLDQAREETYHKNVAIQSLNQQLADPKLRKDDSILAVLLVLCLFHICDSGVAKFQTQFAGVKKLLSLRSNDFCLNTPETKWFTRMFTWFDAMTASVNDREGQLQGHHLDVSALSDEEWALENLAGCDGQLFKTIAKLGRLNVLSQGKSVESSPTLVSRPLPDLPFTSPLLGSADYSDFDGNGWMRIVADEDLFNSKSASPECTTTQFWREWREIRHTLQGWSLDPSIFDSTNPNAPDLTPDQRVDLANISDSFRYSALLYTERLAKPTALSSDPDIQTWVRQSLNFIQQVKSDVYLLWPLFITGSECVDEDDRSTIRERCLDIQKDSGFLNNKSCLDLIEKIWARNPSEYVKQESGSEEKGFRFTRVMQMENNEGEYIVV